MAPPSKNRRRRSKLLNKLSFLWHEFSLVHFLNNPESSYIIAVLLMVLEVFVTVFVIEKIPYTEIDWKAYMQEVEGVINGTLDYKELKGDTGPLVYPAGFVYIFGILYYITLRGTSIYAAQYIFAILYLATLALVFRLYTKASVVPPYALIFMCCTSYRIHSIYVLRLFNDPVAIFVLFIAINLFTEDRWTIGCIIFSLAVSIKMNIMLFAPGLFYILLLTKGLRETVKLIMFCGITQVIIGLPFLISNPVSYVFQAFNLGRVFLYEWTVNWRLLPEDIFVNRYFHVALLVLHIVFILTFYYKWNKQFNSGLLWPKQMSESVSVETILRILFISNFIGMVFCRSLHYQFYVWYFFSLPYLLWCTAYSPVVKLCILGILELTWNTFPSTVLSSSVMHCCHLAILCGLVHHSPKRSSVKVKER